MYLTYNPRIIVVPYKFGIRKMKFQIQSLMKLMRFLFGEPTTTQHLGTYFMQIIISRLASGCYFSIVCNISVNIINHENNLDSLLGYCNPIKTFTIYYTHDPSSKT